ncbi:MAG: glycosyltransferase [Candidatus Roizmanbacteria bacterium]|nr:glycosyltransferase [Candidatus Roizmanbacteria bacterium]MCR4312635.1 glycosyltransferase [Candidatus Roizmanbacteria bacterium]
MKNRSKRVGLYDPYLDTLGGGEKHILSVLEVFAEQGFEIDILWNNDLSNEIKKRFSFSPQLINQLKWVDKKNLKHLQLYDYFFYVTDGSYFFSQATNNFIFCMVPNKKLYNLNLLNRLKLWNYRFISNSPFTSSWLKKWGVSSTVVLPYINDKLIKKNNIKKEKIILSVGRFFPQLHSKNHGEMIKAFKKLKKKSKKFADYKLVLAGGLRESDTSYFEELKKLADNDHSIIFEVNISFDELYKLYGRSEYFWHFTGLGVNEEINPEKVEHLGITPLEAMASGCLTFCYNAGGPKELIKDGENGFLFSDSQNLIDKMIKINLDETLKEKVIVKGKKFVNENFSYEVFREKIILDLIKVRP